MVHSAAFDLEFPPVNCISTAWHDNTVNLGPNNKISIAKLWANFPNNNNHKFQFIVPSIIIIFEIKINSFIIISRTAVIFLSFFDAEE